MTDDRSKYGTDHTSVRVHHAPGGQSSFSLGWGQEEAKKPALTPEQEEERKKREEDEKKKKEEEELAKKANADLPAAGSYRSNPTGRYGGNPPGGKSSITFG